MRILRVKEGNATTTVSSILVTAEGAILFLKLTVSCIEGQCGDLVGFFVF